MAVSNDNSSRISRANNERYTAVVQRGHAEFCQRARKNDDMYLGGGRQWSEEDAEVLESQGRKPIEINEIFDAVNTAIGHEVANRVDISYKPRGMGADDDTALTLSKVAMQIADNNDYQYKETEVFTDGLIQERGYFELSLDFDQNVRGEIRLSVLDPMDVIPDPDGKSYDPDTWNDVTVTRWWTLDDIEGNYGKKARQDVESKIQLMSENDWGESEMDGTQRAKFGMENPLGATYDFIEMVGPSTAEKEDNGRVRVRVVDRQHWRTVLTTVAVYPTGDIRTIEDATEQQIQAAIRAKALIFKRPMRRVRWTISTFSDVLLHDDWSPFKHFTIVPFFPYFRRGQSVGIVTNLIGPQEMLNKAASQYLHIINTTANSGWIVEENSLANMDTEDLEQEGAKTGLVIEYKAGAKKPPEKIQPNTVPTGIDRLIDLGSQKIRMVSGISDAMRGQTPPSASGVAIQSLQFGSQLSLSVPLDNLGRTRKMLGARLLELIQQNLNEEQILRITETDDMGKPQTSELAINAVQEDGSVLNDLTIGEYDTIVTTKPSQVTFQNSQFQQAMELKKLVPDFPNEYLIRYSNLADKQKVLESMAEAKRTAGVNPLDEARAALAKAQAVGKSVEALFSAIKTAAMLRQDPALAALADMIAKSSGFIDADAAPIYPADQAAAAGPPVVPPGNNTHPITPPNPERGMNTGLEAAAQ